MYSIFEALLKERGVTVAEVSRQTGIRQSTLSNWKKRDNQLSGKNAILVADFFDVSVDYLMGRTDDPHGTTPKEQAGAQYYLNEESRQIAQEIFDDKELCALFDAARGCRPEDLQMARDLLIRLKGTNPDG